MPTRPFLRALGLAALATLTADVLLNAVLFRQTYRDTAALLLPQAQLNARVALGWLALLLILAAFGQIFVHTRWRGLRGGLTFGALLAAASVAGVAGLASVFPWPPALLLALAVQQLVNALILGGTFGWIYRAA